MSILISAGGVPFNTTLPLMSPAKAADAETTNVNVVRSWIFIGSRAFFITNLVDAITRKTAQQAICEMFHKLYCSLLGRCISPGIQGGFGRLFRARIELS